MSNGPADTPGTTGASEQFEARQVPIAAGVGLLSTVAMVPVLAVGVAVGVLERAGVANLATAVGLEPNVAVGSAVFVLAGMTLFPLFFLAVGVFLPGRSLAGKGVAFSLIVASGFLVALYTGQSGLSLVGYGLVALVAHLIYGYVFGTVYGRYGTIIEHEV